MSLRANSHFTTAPENVSWSFFCFTDTPEPHRHGATSARIHGRRATFQITTDPDFFWLQSFLGAHTFRSLVFPFVFSGNKYRPHDADSPTYQDTIRLAKAEGH